LFTIVGVLSNVLLSTVLLFILSSSFFIKNKIIPESKTSVGSQAIERVSQSLLLSLTLISLFGYNLPKIGINPEKPLMILGVILAATSVLLMRNFQAINLKVLIPIYFVAITSASWNIIPGLIILAKNGVIFGMTSIFNNDISSYAGMATETLENGFINNHKYFDYDANLFASIYIYQTPNSIIQFFSSITRLDPWQVMMPVLLFVVAYFSISVNRLVRCIFPQMSNFQYNFVSFIIPIIPIYGYISANYFIGQIIATAVILQIISVNIQLWKSKEINFQIGFEFTALLILSIYAYPMLLVPIYFLTLGCNLATFVFQKVSLKNTMVRVLFSIFLALMASVPYLSSCYELIKTQSNISAGWPLPPFNPISLLAYPGLLHVAIPNIATIALWILFVIGIVYLLRIDERPRIFYEKKIANIITATAILLWAFVLIFRGRPITEYSSWKLFTYLLPIILCIVIPRIILNKKFGRNITYLLLGLSLTFPINTWQPYLKNQLFTSASFVNAVQSKQVAELKSLNIDLGHFFESMNAGVIIRGPQIHFPGPTYYNKSFNPKACTLVWNTNKNHGLVIPINESYGLGLGENKECK
jgi:hypothetical protein